MAKNMQPIAKRCKALGISPTVMGYSKKETKRNPGGLLFIINLPWACRGG